MSRQKKNGKRKEQRTSPAQQKITIRESLHPDIAKTIMVVFFLGIAILFLLAGVGQAGPWGEASYHGLSKLFGLGYFLFPLIFFILAFSFISKEEHEDNRVIGITVAASVLLFLSGLGLIDLIASDRGGYVGKFVGSLESLFGVPASFVIMLVVLIISFLVALNRPFNLNLFSLKKKLYIC